MELIDNSTISKDGISTRSSTSKAEALKVASSENSSKPSSSGASVAGPSVKSVKKGDLYWCQMGSYPYWPCMVSPDPESQEVSIRKKSSGRSYEKCHVRFFGDKGSRSWVRRSKLISYKGRSYFDDAIKTMKNKTFEKLYQKGLKSKCWHTAIEEADAVINCKPDNRMIKFENILENSKNFKKTKASSKIQHKKP